MNYILSNEPTVAGGNDIDFYVPEGPIGRAGGTDFVNALSKGSEEGTVVHDKGRGMKTVNEISYYPMKIPEVQPLYNGPFNDKILYGEVNEETCDFARALNEYIEKNELHGGAITSDEFADLKRTIGVCDKRNGTVFETGGLTPPPPISNAKGPAVNAGKNRLPGG